MKALMESLSHVLRKPSAPRLVNVRRPKAPLISWRWRTAMGKSIELPSPAARMPLNADWDALHPHCWPRPSMSVVQAELLVAKAMCTLFAVGAGVIASVLP